MLEGEGSATAPPLLAMLEAAGAHVEGLRLANARAMLKAYRDIAAGRR